MADIICRCGEPWDSTGGLHFSHSDLPWHSYDQLVRGMGCPCCEGKFRPSVARDMAWRESLEALSEGLEPFDGWPDPTAPKYGDTKKGKFIYVPRECPPGFADIDPGFLARIDDLAAMRVEMESRDEVQGPIDVDPKRIYEVKDILNTGFWIRFRPDLVREHGSLGGRVNYDAVVEALEELRTKGNEVYTSLDDGVCVCIANLYGGEVRVFNCVDTLLELSNALGNYPILNDLAFSEAESKAKDKIWEELVEDHLSTLSEWAGIPEKPMRLLIGSTRFSDDLPEQLDDKIELDDKGDAQRQPSREDLEKALILDLEPVNATLLVSDYDRNVYLLKTPASHDFGKPTNPGELVGYLIRDNGKSADAEITRNMAAHCFAHEEHARWKHVPFHVQDTVISLLSSGYL